MELTKEEIQLSNAYLKRRKSISKEIISKLNDNMDSDDFNIIIITALSYEEKHKLNLMLSQKRYLKSNPIKQIKFKKENAERFIKLKQTRNSDTFLEELLDSYEGKINEKN